METPNHILIVDDDPTLLAAYTAVLQSAGYATLSACGAEQAHTLLKEQNHRIAATITDLNMAPVNGLTLLAQLKAAGVSVPSILFTGADQFTYAEARKSGVSAFLVKPIASENLLLTVKAVLAQSAN